MVKMGARAESWPLGPWPIRLALPLLEEWSHVPPGRGQSWGTSVIPAKFLYPLFHSEKFLYLGHKLLAHPTHGRHLLFWRKGSHAMLGTEHKCLCFSARNRLSIRLSSEKLWLSPVWVTEKAHGRGPSAKQADHCAWSQLSSSLLILPWNRSRQGLYRNLCRLNSVLWWEATLKLQASQESLPGEDSPSKPERLRFSVEPGEVRMSKDKGSTPLPASLPLQAKVRVFKNVNPGKVHII